MLKNILLSSACCVSVLAVAPLASAAGFERKADARSIVADTNTPAASASQGVDARVQNRGSAPVSQNVSTPVQRQSSNPTQRMVSTDARQLAVVADAKKAKASKNASGKPSEQISSTAGASGASGAQGASQNPIAARMDPNARAMGVVASAKKAKASKNNGGKPSEQISSSSSSTAGSGSGAGSENPIAARMDTGARSREVVASAQKAKASKNNGGKPSGEAKSSGGMNIRSSDRSSGHGGGRFAQFNDRASARAPGTRGSPGERATSHCNSRGMCF